MSQNKFVISRFFTIPVHELFAYFSDSHLLEKWAYPDGLTLRVPRFDAVKGGRYRFEHTSPGGVYVAKGHIRRIVENQLIRMVDDEITGPGGFVAQKLNCDLTFRPVAPGSEVTILQSGFEDVKYARECEDGWRQCLDHLQELVKNSGLRQYVSPAVMERELPG